MANQVYTALEILSKQCGMVLEKGEFITGDTDEEETTFKTMSDAGKRDNEFAQNIQKIFKNKKIPFKHGLQPRVFCVKNIDLLKVM